MSKFSEKRIRKRIQKNGGGSPLVRGDGPIIKIKLQESWTDKGQLWPTVYVGPIFPLNRIIKFLASQGLSRAQLGMLKKGVAVGAKIGDQIRMFQIVSPESESGTYRHGENGLEPVSNKELMEIAKIESQADQYG